MKGSSVQPSSEEIIFNKIAIENAQDIILWSIENGRLVYVNPAASVQLGYARNELLAMTIQDFDINYNREIWPQHWAELRERGSMTFESQYKRKDQSTFFVEIKTSIIFYDDKEYNCAIVRDISERKKYENDILEKNERLKVLTEAANRAKVNAEESELELSKLFENMEQGFALHEIICDANNKPIDYRYKLINKAFGKLTGIDPSKFIGKTVRELLPNTEPYWIENFGSVAQTGKTLHLQNYSQEFDKYYDVVAYCPRPGSFAVVFNDVTELKKKNVELEKVNEELDRFVYSASHDLRAPLASILGLLNLVEMDQTLPGQHHHFIDLIRKSALRMDGFIGDILAYSFNSRAALKIEKIDFNDVIERVKFNFIGVEKANRIEVKTDVKEVTSFCSDRSRIEIIFNNLFSNAVKYLDQKKEKSFLKIEVNVSDGNAKIKFLDNGIGIEEKYLDKIFQMFFRASEHSKGSGLGLYILKETVRKLSGHVKVESVYGKQTIFEVTIPSLE